MQYVAFERERVFDSTLCTKSLKNVTKTKITHTNIMVHHTHTHAREHAWDTHRHTGRAIARHIHDTKLCVCVCVDGEECYPFFFFFLFFLVCASEFSDEKLFSKKLLPLQIVNNVRHKHTHMHGHNLICVCRCAEEYNKLQQPYHIILYVAVIVPIVIVCFFFSLSFREKCCAVQMTLEK